MATPHSRTRPVSNNPSTDAQAACEPAAEAGRFGTTDTRVDPPHAVAAPHDDAVEAAAGSPLEVDDGDQFDPNALETLRNQARQLSLLLSERQAGLDRREAEWQRQLAHHEAEMRSARLWFDQRRAELDEREAGLTVRERELEQRYAQQRDAASALEVLRCEHEASTAAWLSELEDRRRELDEDAARQALEAATHRGLLHELDAREETIRREQDELLRAEEALTRRREEIESLRNRPSEYQQRMQEELDERAAVLERREEEFAGVELQVRQALVEIERLRTELFEERERLAAQQKHDRLELAAERRRLEHDAAEKQQLLERQNEQLDFRRAAVQQQQAELAEAQRETLEMRLVVDELWTQLSGMVPSAALTENAARLRGRLAEQYRLQQHELAAQRSELVLLRSDLATESDKLRLQSTELQRWAEARHEEIERQAAFLTRREQELDRQDGELAQRAQVWRMERERLELEIRRLEGELRRGGLETSPSARPVDDHRAAALR